LSLFSTNLFARDRR